MHTEVSEETLRELLSYATSKEVSAYKADARRILRRWLSDPLTRWPEGEKEKMMELSDAWSMEKD